MKEVLLFGSRARGTHTDDSDADLAVILTGARGERRRSSGEMAEIAFTVLLETGILVQAVPLWQEEIDQPDSFSNPGLIAAIGREERSLSAGVSGQNDSWKRPNGQCSRLVCC